jgi:hypothetical protein
MKKVKRRIKIMEITLGILILVKKSRMGKRMNERKIARKKGKSTGLASLKRTPIIKTTMMIKDAVATLLSSIINPRGVQIL